MYPIIFVIPLAVLAVFTLLNLSENHLPVYSPRGYILSRNPMMIFFSWVLLGPACLLVILNYLDIIAEASQEICMYVAVGLALLTLLPLCVFFVCKLEVMGDRMVFTHFWGGKTTFLLTDVRKVRYSPEFCQLILETETKKIRVSKFWKGCWYLLQRLRKENVPGVTLAEKAFSANGASQYRISFPSYEAMVASKKETDAKYVSLMRQMLRHYENCVVDNSSNAADFWNGIQLALTNARLKGESLGLLLPERLRRYALVHSDVLSEDQTDAISRLAYDRKYRELYQEAAKQIGKENLYSAKDFAKVMYYLEVVMGCTPFDVFFGGADNKPADRMYAVYGAQGERTHALVLSVGAGTYRMPAPQKYMERAEIALAIPSCTPEDMNDPASGADYLGWLAHPATAADGAPLFYGAGNLFGKEDVPLYETKPYHYMAVCYLEGTDSPWLNLGRKRINFYQLCPLYPSEARLWTWGDPDLILTHMGWPGTAADPARPVVTEDALGITEEGEEASEGAESPSPSGEENDSPPQEEG